MSTTTTGGTDGMLQIRYDGCIVIINRSDITGTVEMIITDPSRRIGTVRTIWRRSEEI